jgi:hypothetical protein
MRIYKINLEHRVHGLNWSSKKVAAESFEEAVRKAKPHSYEKIESVDLLESTE